MRNAELYLKEATVIYSFHPLTARLPALDIASKFSEKTRLLPLVQFRAQEQAFRQLITRRVSDDTKLLRFLFAEMTGAVATQGRFSLATESESES